MDVNEIIIADKCDIKFALSKIDETGLGSLFIINENEELVGIITDGDIRRALLKGKSLNASVVEIMNRSFTSLPVDTDTAEILNKLNETIKIIPLVDNQNRLVDYASINKIRRISIASPMLDGNELAYVTDCIKTNWISSQGKYVRKFEDLFTVYHENRTSLAVSNGTVALHLALVALGIGEGDEVLVPDLTFAASVNAIIYTGAIPVLVDVDPNTWNIDIEEAKRMITPRSKAIMPVHLYGHPCDMDAVCDIAHKFNLFIIEDCAESLGSFFQDRPVGVFGDVATFSFFGNKTITTGEGGMVVFKNPKIAELAAVLRDHGMEKSRRYWHVQIGYNYRLTNIQAAIGVAQFERLTEFVQAKRKIAEVYNNCIGKIDFFIMPIEHKDCLNSYWLYTFLVKENSPFTRDNLIEYLSDNGIESRPVFFPIHIMPPYIEYGGTKKFKVSKQISAQGMSLPSSVMLGDHELLKVCDTIQKFCNKY